MARKVNTRLEIISVGTRFFVEKGFSETTISHISRKLGISKGNITFYFPTKEDFFGVFTDMLCDYQWKVMDEICQEGYTSLLAYCLELASVGAICDENEKARDIYSAVYTHDLSLEIMRKNETERTKRVFGQFCKDWSEEDFVMAEILVSGIKYGTLVKGSKETDLEKRISATLSTIMRIYKVPEEMIEIKLGKVFAMDFRCTGRDLLSNFAKFIDDENEKARRESSGDME